jgi:flavin reductase (DIM6/NTAB) family NADH-FMN oxidoreductase RutF
VASPSFAEAELVLECRKLFWQDIDPTHFVDASLEKHYPKKDYHRMFFGEVVEIRGK